MNANLDLAYTLYINAKPEKVWEAWVSKEGVNAIFFGSELRTTFQPGDGYEYVGSGNDGEETVHVYGKIIECVPAQVLRMSEHAGPSYNPNHADYETEITFKLEPVGTCTKLTLINDHWPANHPSYDNTKEHWPVILSNVKTYVETGKTLDLGW